MQREFLSFPLVLLQLPPPCVDGPNDSSVVRVVMLWPQEPYVPKPLDVPFARKDVTWLQKMCPPFSLVPPGPPCPSQLFAGLTGNESSRRVNEVDIVDEIANYLLPFVPRFVKINIQVPQDKGDAALWTGFPSSLKIFHPHVSVGRMYIPMQ
jgi:hypothetical protein